jgi:hypothetical protein
MTITPVLVVSHVGGCRCSPNIIDSQTGYQHGGTPDINKDTEYIRSLVSHQIHTPLYRGNIYWNLSEKEELIHYAIDHIKSIYHEHDITLDAYIEEASGAIKISFRGVSVLYSVIYLQEISYGMSCSSDTEPVEFMNWRFSTVGKSSL